MSTSFVNDQGDAVIVTGGTTGIGLAISLHFAAAGKQVYTVSRRGEDNVGELDRQVKERGVPRPYVQRPTSSSSARLVEIANELAQAGVRLRTVVACAGIGVRKLTLDVTDEELRSVLDVNLYGLMTTFRVFAPLALKQPGARFIAISSLNAIQGMRLRGALQRRQGGRGWVRAGACV